MKIIPAFGFSPDVCQTSPCKAYNYSAINTLAQEEYFYPTISVFEKRKFALIFGHKKTRLFKRVLSKVCAVAISYFRLEEPHPEGQHPECYSNVPLTQQDDILQTERHIQRSQVMNGS